MAGPCSITVKMACTRLSDVLNCTFDFTNESADDYHICQYHTPLEGIRNRFLTVTDEGGRELQYMGILMKRLPPKKRHYTPIKAGDTISATIAVNDAYQFDCNCTYTIQYTGHIVYALSEHINKLRDSDTVKESWVHSSDGVLATASVTIEDAKELRPPKLE